MISGRFWGDLYQIDGFLLTKSTKNALLKITIKQKSNPTLHNTIYKYLFKRIIHEKNDLNMNKN